MNIKKAIKKHQKYHKLIDKVLREFEEEIDELKWDHEHVVGRLSEMSERLHFRVNCLENEKQGKK